MRGRSVERPVWSARFSNSLKQRVRWLSGRGETMKRKLLKMSVEERAKLLATLNKTVAARRAQLVKVATTYFLEGLAKKDFSAIPYDDDVTLHAPVAPGGIRVPREGKEILRNTWWPLLLRALEDMQGVRVIEHYINEDLTSISTEAEISMVNPPSTLLVTTRLTVNARGKIIEQKDHFDPHGLASLPAYKLTAKSYFDGLANRDLSAVPYTDNALLRSPLNPAGGADVPIVGRPNILAFLDSLLPKLGKVEVIRYYIEENWFSVRANLELNTDPPAVLRVVDCFEIKNGRIVEQETHCDPRPGISVRA